MDEVELPPANLILQALQAIRLEVRGTNDRLDHLTGRVDNLTGRVDNLTGRVDHLTERVDALNERVDQMSARIDETNVRVDSLRVFTVQKLTDLNAKVDQLGEHLGSQITQLGDRLENVLTGQLGQDVRDLKARMLVVEERLASRTHESSAPYDKTPTPEKP